MNKIRYISNQKIFFSGLKLERRIEEAVPAGQQLQELGMKLRYDDACSDTVNLINKCKVKRNLILIQSYLQDDLEDDRLMMDRSPLGSQLGSNEDEICDSDSDLDDDMETTTDGERRIYPWMKKIHVAGIGKWNFFFNSSSLNCSFMATIAYYLCVLF